MSRLVFPRVGDYMDGERVQLQLNFRDPACLPTCDDVCMGYCQIPGPEPSKGDGIVRGKRPAGWVAREWTVEEIEGLEEGKGC